MDALEALHSRISSPRVGEQPPSAEQLNNLYLAALSAPDHALLRPWRFLVVEGEARTQLGRLFGEATRLDRPEATDLEVEKAAGKAQRAPVIIVAVVKLQEHPKVPEIEQYLSAGAAVQNMLLAAHAQGLGAMWRTGGMAYHPHVEQGLGLSAEEKIIGYLYVGQLEGPSRSLPSLAVDNYFSVWEPE